MEDYVLYVAKDKTNRREFCRGSKMCLQITEVLPDKTINVQDCDMLREKNVRMPSWLDGTPILVSNETGNIYKGSIALKYLREMLEEYSANRKENANNENKNETTIFDDNFESKSAKEAESEEEGEEEKYDPWKNDFDQVDSSASEKPKATQQDVEEFMRKRQQSMSQPDMNGTIPTIPQESS